jgi:ribosomal protein L11 methyltransferase
MLRPAPVSYLELSFDLSGQPPETAETACFQSGALAVTFSDGSDEPVLEPKPGEMRLWRHTRMQALFDASRAHPALIASLAAAVGKAPEELQARAVPDRVWEREWLRDFHPMPFGRRLWICPRHESVADPHAIVVRLDPGLAFGTGTHPSTAMCLQWLDGIACGADALAGVEVVDYGCGSGVLAIAALKLGARRAYAYDIDPQALLATAQNAADNEVEDRLTICDDAAQIPPGRDLLMANILAGTLIELRHELTHRLAPGARCVLSGILAEQEAQVIHAFAQGIDMTRFAQHEDWVSVSGIRRS